jgi:hypothetical protein
MSQKPCFDRRRDILPTGTDSCEARNSIAWAGLPRRATQSLGISSRSGSRWRAYVSSVSASRRPAETPASFRRCRPASFHRRRAPPCAGAMPDRRDTILDGIANGSVGKAGKATSATQLEASRERAVTPSIIALGRMGGVRATATLTTPASRTRTSVNIRAYPSHHPGSAAAGSCIDPSEHHAGLLRRSRHVSVKCWAKRATGLNALGRTAAQTQSDPEGKSRPGRGGDLEVELGSNYSKVVCDVLGSLLGTACLVRCFAGRGAVSLTPPGCRHRRP